MTKSNWLNRLACAAMLAGLAAAPALADDRPLVQIEQGSLAGATLDGADKFLGIPFAAPPVGALRWQPPAAPANWSETRDASAYAGRCSAPLAGDGPRLVNEDCLYLDVYRPAGAATDTKLPVMVFFPGGGNTSGSTDIYDGSRMATEGNALVVVPAYRLGAFGFLALPALTAEDATNGSGGYGLLDQIAALKWVQNNVAAFGGNPADVTLTGQSAGGSGVCNLLSAQSTKGLYKQAVIQSGVCNANIALADAETAGTAYAAKLGCTDPADITACLREQPADAVLDNWTDVGPMTDTPFGTKLLPLAPVQAIASGAFVQVPTLVGVARNEMWGFMHAMYPLD